MFEFTVVCGQTPGSGGTGGGDAGKRGTLRNQPRGQEGVPRNNAPKATGNGTLRNQPKGQSGGVQRNNAQKGGGQRLRSIERAKTV